MPACRILCVALAALLAGCGPTEAERHEQTLKDLREATENLRRETAKLDETIITIYSFRCGETRGKSAELIGEFTNTGTRALDGVRVVGAFRDSAGDIVGNDSSAADVSPLHVGQSSTFRIIGPPASLVATCGIYAAKETRTGVAITVRSKPAAP